MSSYSQGNWDEDNFSSESIALNDFFHKIALSYKCPKDDFIPRDYQVVLANTVKISNKIIYLPINRDKKYTCVSILKSFSYKIEKSKKKVFYLIDSYARISSIADFLQRHLYFKVVSVKEQCSNKTSWLNSISNAQIVVISTDIYLNALLQWYTKISETYLFIFDDCIYGKNNHSMNEILNYIHDVQSSDWPQIVGFTSSLIHHEENNNIFKCLNDMEGKYKSSIVSSLYCDIVKRYLPRMNVKFVKFNPFNKKLDEFINNLSYLEQVIGKTIALINKMKICKRLLKKKCLEVFKDLLYFLNMYGPYCAFVVASIHRVTLEKIKILSNDSVYFILSSIISDLYMIRFLIYENILKSGSLDNSVTIIKNCPGKIVRLFFVLYKLDMYGSCIIFVDKCITARMIAYILQKLSKYEDKMAHVLADFIVNSNSIEPKSDREMQLHKKQQKLVEKRFSKGLINVLILSCDANVDSNLLSTSWIIYFDMPSNYNNYLMTRKFASKDNNSNFFFLEETGDEEKFLQNKNSLEEFIELDLALKDIVLMKDVNDEERLRKSFLIKETETELIERFPMLITKTKKRASLSSAINIVNQYCQCLPGDAFSFSAPQWSVFKKDGGIVCKLRLPVQSGIESPIECSSIKNIKLVKQVTALETVKFLYKCGHLNDNLRSTFYNTKNEFKNANLFPYWRNEDPEMKPGSSKCFRTVHLKFPNWFNKTSPQPNVQCYLHIIHMKPIYETPSDNSKLFFHNLMLRKDGYGILSSKKLPPICKFPVYTDLGQVDISIEVNAKTLILSEEEIACLSRCHKFIFLDVLQIVKGFLISDSSNGDNSYYFVPLTELDDTMTIAWDVANNQCKKAEIVEPTEEERLHADYAAHNYLGKVVTPWYRMPSQRYYIVTNACTSLKPASQFPSEKYDTFTQYYFEKHSLEVKHPLQPLVEARFIPNNLKCTRPRAQTASMKKKEGEKDQDLNVILVPEFCVKQYFPAVYWYKAIVLLAITHRLHFILLAEELRRKFAGRIETDDFPNDPLDVLYADEASLPKVKDLSKSVVPLFSILTEVKLAKNSRKYVWKEEQLPEDVDRKIDEVHILDLMAYCDFIKGSVEEEYFPECYPRQEYRYPSFLDLQSDLSFSPKQRDIVQALTSSKSDDIFNLKRFKIFGNSFINFSVSLWLYKLHPQLNVLKVRHLKRRITGKQNIYYCGAQLELGSYCQTYDFSVNNDWFLTGFCIPDVFVNILENSFIPPEVIFKVEIPLEEQYSGQISAETRNMIQDRMLDYYNHTSKQNENPLKITYSDNGDHNHTIVYFKKQSVCDKSVADSLRALTGVYLANNGIQPGFKLLQQCGILEQNVTIDEVCNFDLVETEEVYIGGYDILKYILNYDFKNKKLLLEALTHHSYFGDLSTACNHKLAFLGESILDLLITGYIHEYYGHLRISDFEDLRNSLVSDIVFAFITVKFGLHKFLLVDSIQLIEKIDKYIERENIMNFSFNRSDFLFLIEETNSAIKESVDIPKICGDILKAIVAAVYLDTKGNLIRVWEIVFNFIKDEIGKFTLSIPKDPVKLFGETAVPTMFGNSVKYKNSDLVIIPLHIEIDDVKKIYFGIGSSKNQAKRIAAKLAIKDMTRKDI